MLEAIKTFLIGNGGILIFMTALPALFGVLLWLLRKLRTTRNVTAVFAALLNLLFACAVFSHTGLSAKLSLAPYGFELSFKADAYSAFFVLFTAFIFLFISIYTCSFLADKKYAGSYLFCLYTGMSMINGAMLSDNLGVMLFFWEGLLGVLLGLLLINNLTNPKTAVKMLTISASADLLLMFGIIITGKQAGTLSINEIGALPIAGVGIVGFACLMLGALGKGGVMPFHSWIPDAAGDAPTAFMVAFPSALEKILGMYLAARVVLKLYDFQPGAPASVLIMSMGTVTVVFAVAMALIQKDMKRLLSYHAVSQFGYMVLGIGTGLPIGIVAGLFHLINNAIYKSGLFMIAGAVEKQTGTTDLRKISGLRLKMPVTAACFTVLALSISGVPGFNGFFSKELVFDAALESNIIFYTGAVLGAFMTALSFLKMGRSLFFGKLKLPEGMKDVKEPKAGTLLPVCALSLLCVLFGLYNALPLDKFLVPSLGFDEKFSGWPHSSALIAISTGVLLLAVLDHIYGSRKTKNPLNAADHIHYAPILKSVYAAADRGIFDMYNWMLSAAAGFCAVCAGIERGVSWVYDKGVPGLVISAGTALHKFDNGRLSRYLWLAAAGVALLTLIFLFVIKTV